MWWIGVAISAHFTLAVVSVVDKYLLSGPISNPKLYALAIGLLGGVLFVLLPFGVLEVPAMPYIVLGLLAGALQIAAIFAFFSALARFEASRVVPAIGGMLPVLTLVFVALLGMHEGIGARAMAAFFLLVAGSVTVSVERTRSITAQSLYSSFAAAFLFALFVVSSKFVYDAQHFLSALLWIMMGSFLAALFFLLSGETRAEIRKYLARRKTKKSGSWRMFVLFVCNQGLGGLGFVLQNWAVALAPFAYIAFVNALEGVKYVFVFLLATTLSVVFPRVLKEEITKAVVAQKIAAIALIGFGLAVLAL